MIPRVNGRHRDSRCRLDNRECDRGGLGGADAPPGSRKEIVELAESTGKISTG